jgi:large subunit ribosomal protein L7/L12
MLKMNCATLFAYLSFWGLVWSKPILSARLGAINAAPLDIKTLDGGSGGGLRHRALSTTSSLTGMVLYDTSTKTNITLTNNMTIVSADPKYTLVALLSSTAGIESVRFHVQAGKSTLYTKVTKVDSKFLFTLCGSSGANLNACGFLKYGNHTVTATAFAKDGKQVGSGITLTFTIAPPPSTGPPTNAPTKPPAKLPTNRPTEQPTKRPTAQPTIPPTLAPTNAPAMAKKTLFDVMLISYDASIKLALLKKVREITGLGLREAKALIESVPAALVRNVRKAEAEQIKAELDVLGAETEIV